jgi:hypothetical protein
VHDNSVCYTTVVENPTPRGILENPTGRISTRKLISRVSKNDMTLFVGGSRKTFKIARFFNK